MNSLLFDTLDNAHSSYSFRALSLLTFFLFSALFFFCSVFQYLASLGDQQENDSAKTRPIPSLSQSPFLVTSLALRPKTNFNLVLLLKKKSTWWKFWENPRILKGLKGITAGRENWKEIFCLNFSSL